MSKESADIVRRFIDAFNHGGIEAALPFLDPEVEWITTGLFVEQGTYRGHEGVIRYIGALAEEFDDFRTQPQELIDAGQRIVLPVRISGRGKRSGAGVDLRLTMVISLRDDLIVRVRNYEEEAEAFRAAGLSG
jgi:ketosteroid isomerase-like protein